jgi:hypothetical protein
MIFNFIITCLFVALVLIAGYSDKKDEELFNKDYCQNVLSGKWSDYKNIFSDICNG